MDILEITMASFPLYLIESRVKSEEGNGMAWTRFTKNPIATSADATAHRERCVAEYGSFGEFQIVEYTPALWQRDLIEVVLKDPDAVRRGLSVLRPETLADLLKAYSEE
jgi:hypothetical protein